jgi:hypothetical protein
MHLSILFICLGSFAVFTTVSIIAWYAVTRIRIYNATTSKQALERFLHTPAAKKISRYSFIVEKIASKYDSHLPMKLGLDLIWSDKLYRKPGSSGLMKKVIRYGQPEGIFSAFSAGLSDEKNKNLYKRYIEHNSAEKILRETAEKANGRDFNAESALKMLENHIEILRILTKSHRWEHRYFGYKILLRNNQDSGDLRLCRNAFADPEMKIRNLAIREHIYNKEYYSDLFKRLIEDPVLFIRVNAKNRIIKNYKEFYEPDYTSLKKYEKIRFISELDFAINIDKKLAYEIIKDNDDELVYPAARCMDKNGELHKIFSTININDKDEYESKLEILQKAARFNCIDFLAELKTSKNTGTLMAGAEILNNYGPRQHISDLANTLFSEFTHDINDPEFRKLYKATVKTIASRGDETACRLYRNELEKYAFSDFYPETLLAKIPAEQDMIFFDILLTLFKNPTFSHRKLLFEKLAEMPESRVIPAMFQLLRNSLIPVSIQAETLSLLHSKNKDYYMQDIIENLHVLPLSQSIFIMKHLLESRSEKATQTVKNILMQNDSVIKPVLIKTLTETELKDFISSEIQNYISDPVAEVREAACYAADKLLKKQVIKLLTPLLRDPVPQVRSTAAETYSANAEEKDMELLFMTMGNPDEFLSIKESIIKGLNKSNSKSAFNTILKISDSTPELSNLTFDIFCNTEDDIRIKELINYYDHAEKHTKKIIEDSFCHFDYSDKFIQDLFMTELSKSEKQILNTILYKSKYIDRRIFELQNMSRRDRRKATEGLSNISEYHAIRGLIYAAFDTDKQVRTIAIEAIKKYAEKNQETAKMLLSDSNRIVRKQAALFFRKYPELKIS